MPSDRASLETHEANNPDVDVDTGRSGLSGVTYPLKNMQDTRPDFQDQAEFRQFLLPGGHVH